MIESPGFGKTSHLHGGFEGRGSAPYRLLRRRTESDQAEVDLRRIALVQPKLLRTKESPQRGCREVKEPEFHGLLELVGVFACQKDPRNMGLDHFDAICRMRIEPRVAQRPKQRRADLGDGINVRLAHVG